MGKLSAQIFDSLNVKSVDIELLNENYPEQTANVYSISLKISIEIEEL